MRSGSGRQGGQPQYDQYGNPVDAGPQFPASPKKSKSGLYLILGIGGAVLLLLIFIIIVAASGGLSKQEQELYNRVMAHSATVEPSPMLTPEEITAAQALKDKLPQEQQEAYGIKLGLAAGWPQKKAKEQASAERGKKTEAARKEVEPVMQNFFAALKKKDIAGMAAVTDGEAYARNIRGGQKKPFATAWEAPSTWHYTVKYEASKPKLTWTPGGAFSSSELLSKGFEHLVRYYGGNPELTMEYDKDDKGQVSVGGEEKGDTYMVAVTFKIKGIKEDLTVYISGQWMGPAKVVFVADKSGGNKEVQRDIAAAAGGGPSRERDGGSESGGGEHTDPRTVPPDSTKPAKTGDNGKTGDTTKPVGEKPSEEPANPESSEPDHPSEHEVEQIADPVAWDNSTHVKDTGAIKLVESKALRDVVDQLKKGYSVHGDAIRTFKKGSSREKLYVIGACVDVLVNAARQGKAREDEVSPIVWLFLTQAMDDWMYDDGTEGERITQTWLDAIANFERINTNCWEFAWYINQLYDELGKQIKSEEDIIRKRGKSK